MKTNRSANFSVPFLLMQAIELGVSRRGNGNHYFRPFHHHQDYMTGHHRRALKAH
jgi:hypothetical protein